MSNPTLFSATTFNTNLLPEQAVVFDANGIIRPGPITNPGQLGYTKTNLDTYLEDGLAQAGYSDYVSDIDTQFPAATYFYGISSAITTTNGTTYSIDNGLRGTSGSDVIFDTQGNDIINARGGDDLIVVSFGNDAVKAGGGNDTVFTFFGDDIVAAGSGRDIVILGDGDDQAQGNGGADLLLGENGNDCLDGGGGRDRLDGGAGLDTLTGGRGKDVFVFNASMGDDIITDLEGRDTIELDTATGASSFSDITSIGNQIGSDLVLRFTSGDNLVLEDTTLNDLTANMFDFV